VVVAVEEEQEEVAEVAVAVAGLLVLPEPGCKGSELMLSNEA
jgi:hypothetical protein